MMTTTNAKALTVDTIRSRDGVRFGKKYEGQVAEGHRAEIVPGKSVTLHGAIKAGHRYVRDEATGRMMPNPRPMLYCVHFEVGDRAVCHSFNLTYTGRIRSIRAKTVTVVEYEGTRNEKVHRLSLYDFDRLNWDFDAEAIAKRNAEWMD